MNQLAILRRHLCILRQVQSPFLYPSKQQLLDRLQQEGIETAPRTLEKDQQDIESYYGLRIKFSHPNRGYYLNQQKDEDFSDFRQFLRLLERCERLAFLTHASDVLNTGKYLLLEENHTLQGLHHMPTLWEALRSQRQISFTYQAFHSLEPKRYQVDPLVIQEYRNRWYLAGWDQEEERFKTFGLERMQEPILADTPVQGDRRSQFISLTESALGVFVSPEDEVELLVLHFHSQIAPYIRTVPIHRSQKLIQENQKGLWIELRLIINLELEREILSYGEQVEVLEPIWLREKVRERAEMVLKKYLNK